MRIYALTTIVCALSAWGCKEKARAEPAASVAAAPPPVVPAPRAVEAPSRSAPPPERPDAPDVTAKELLAEFEENGIAAADKFSGVYQLTGKVEEVGVDPLGRPFVKLSTGKRFKEVQAMLDADDADDAKGLKKGQQAAFLCIGARKIARVQAERCSPFDPTPAPAPSPAAAAPAPKPAGTGTVIDVNAL